MRCSCILAISMVAGCATASSGVDPQDAPARQTDAPGRQIDAPPQDLCTSTATCIAATDLGSVSGDTGSQVVMMSGFQAAWFKVRVTEDDNGIPGIKLSVTAQLTSPASANYDVFTYVNTGTDTVECTTPSGTPTNNGNVDSSRELWGEGSIPNGVNDGRTVSIEVRPISGTCSASAPWQLVVTGNT
jgi:hypothetical protein